APAHSYFMNYVGLDRYNRQGVRFVWDARERRFRYDGAGWRELVRRYPHTPEAEQARRHLAR
ncbi:glutaminyl-peptide cyclotransferase, partial [Escherichia coli]|nr:glutaminyl-peptide cyclotransferase [Escherichia coli]